MSNAVWSENDREITESAIDEAVEYLRIDCQKTSVRHRNKRRKIINNELLFLRENFPESRILQEDLSDISLDLERE